MSLCALCCGLEREFKEKKKKKELTAGLMTRVRLLGSGERDAQMGRNGRSKTRGGR